MDNEIKRMQQLAGLIKENNEDDEWDGLKEELNNKYIIYTHIFNRGSKDEPIYQFDSWEDNAVEIVDEFKNYYSWEEMTKFINAIQNEDDQYYYMKIFDDLTDWMMKDEPTDSQIEDSYYNSNNEERYLSPGSSESFLYIIEK